MVPPSFLGWMPVKTSQRMLCELPLAPGEKTGWPWSAEAAAAAAPMPDGLPCPRISVVTPSFNQGQFLEETIRSVLLQGYPDLEYIVIDGGSTDGSLGIIREYEPWLAFRVSEKDRGQSHAINKGFARASGEIWFWLNSDDLLAPGALRHVAEIYERRPTPWITGAGYIGTSWGDPARRYLMKSPTLDELKRGKTFLQPSCYFTRELLGKVGSLLREDLHFAMDYELWCRFAAAGYFPVLTPEALSLAREHPQMKARTCSRARYWQERGPIIRQNLGASAFFLWRGGELLRRNMRRLERRWPNVLRP